MQSFFNVYKNRTFTFKISLPIILVVKALDTQSRVPDLNLLAGFKIKVISAFHSVKVDSMSSRNSWGLSVEK